MAEKAKPMAEKAKPMAEMAKPMAEMAKPMGLEICSTPAMWCSMYEELQMCKSKSER